MATDILLVDDEPQILSILQESLQAAGFQVRAAPSGPAALTAIREAAPDVMVVDLRMPEMNGLELMEQVRGRMPSAPMVVLTGYSDTKSAVEALRLGAFDYLTKPVDMERLIQTLRNAAEHRRLRVENQALLHRLREANRIKTEFINGMSHEVRTPLGHITGFAELLEDTVESLPEKQIGYLRNIRKAANRLLHLFDDVVQFSVLRSGDVQVQPERVHLDAIVNRVVENRRADAVAKSQTLDALPGGLEACLDHAMAEKMLTLLVDNAVKFTPEGGRIEIATELRIPGRDRLPTADDVTDVARWIGVAVTDTGPGVDEDSQERIFEVFEQGDSTLGRVHEGTGLGLALARSLARIHRGDVFLEKTSKKGSTFSVVLPDLAD